MTVIGQVDWAEQLHDAPYIAIILALIPVVIYLFRSRDKLQTRFNKLQTKHTENLVKATSALQGLTAEYLKQAFTDSAAWQDRVKALEALYQKQIHLIKKHTADDAEAAKHIGARLDDLRTEIKESEGRTKERLDLMRQGS